MKLADYDWRFINNLSYRIHAIPDFAQMRMDFIKYIELGIHYDMAFWGMVDKSRTPRIYDIINMGYQVETLRDYVENPMSDEPLRIVSSSSTSYVYRGSDLYNTEDEWEKSEYYQKFAKPNHIYYILVMGLVFDRKQIGTLTFAREKNSGNFSERDVEIFNLLKDHLALRVSRVVEATATPDKGQQQEKDLSPLFSEKGLTKREQEVIQCLQRGNTTAEICQTLFISQTTLKKHITNAYRKLGIHSRGEINKFRK